MLTYLEKDPATSTLRYCDHTNYDDLRFPASAINPKGGVNDADRDSDDGSLLFDKSSVEIVAGIGQMPHSWKPGKVYPHLHWQATSTGAGNVLWKLEYDVADVNGNFAGSWTELTVLDAAPENANTHLIAAFDAVDLGSYKLSCIFKWRISRVADDETDTYDADAKLLEFDLHYEIESVGSGQEYRK